MTDRTWYLIVVGVLAALAGIALGMLLSVAVPVEASAQTGEFGNPMAGVEIDLEQIHRGAPGDRFLEAEIDASGQFGWTCMATLDRRNNESIHDGTNLIIVSGANSVTFGNIESVSFDEATRSFTIDGTIQVYTELGVDGVSSMGFLLEFECNPPTTTTTHPDTSSTTTTTTTGATTTTTSTVPLVTTTTEPPPINGIDTGGGACADGACDGFRLWQTWGALLGAGALVLAWAVVRSGATKPEPDDLEV